MASHRLLTNRLLREAFLSSITSRGSLERSATRLAREERAHTGHARIAADLALSLAKGHRRRARTGIRAAHLPFIRQPFLRADDATFHFDPNTGHVRVSLRAGDWAGFDVVVPAHHRQILARRDVRIKQMHLTETRMILVYGREAPKPYEPRALLALDTNEHSLDAVQLVTPRTRKFRPRYVQVRFDSIPRIQACAALRRQGIQVLKAHDRRVLRELTRRIGRREHHRVEQRLHAIANGLVGAAAERRAALVLEDLRRPLGRRRRSGRTFRFGGLGKPRGRGRGALRGLRRRLSSWPRRSLHRLIVYKAEDRGVPVYFVDPRNTSKTCPMCGVVTDHRSRVGAVFACRARSWRLDRQLNAGLNIARSALAERPGLGALWLAPDGLPQDVMNLLYPTAAADGHGKSGGKEGSYFDPAFGRAIE